MLPDYNLLGRYKEFNSKYFEGKLPVVPMKFAILKGCGGKVSFKARHRDGQLHLVQGTAQLTMSSAYKKTSEHTDAILLHEMIHLWMIFVENDLREQHGMKFREMRKKISAISGIAVPMTDAVAGLELAIDKPKPYLVFLIEDQDGYSTQFAILSTGTWATGSDMLKYYAEMWRDRFKKKVSIYRITTLPWTHAAHIYKVKRKPNATYSRNEKNAHLFDDLRKNGELIFGG